MLLDRELIRVAPVHFPVEFPHNPQTEGMVHLTHWQLGAVHKLRHFLDQFLTSPPPLPTPTLRHLVCRRVKYRLYLHTRTSYRCFRISVSPPLKNVPYGQSLGAYLKNTDKPSKDTSSFRNDQRQTRTQSSSTRRAGTPLTTCQLRGEQTENQCACRLCHQYAWGIGGGVG